MCSECRVLSTAVCQCPCTPNDDAPHSYVGTVFARCGVCGHMLVDL